VLTEADQEPLVAGARNGAAMMAAMGRLAAVAALAGLLSACSLARFSAPDAIFDLSAPDDVATKAGTPAQLLIAVPSASAALDTARIAARPTDSEYAYLPGAVWSDTLPKLLQERLTETFQNTGRVRAAGRPGQSLLINYQIIMDIRAFEIAGDSAVAEFHVMLLNDRNGVVVGRRIVKTAATLADSSNAGSVAALDAAMDEAFGEIAGWVLQRI
jgi:cholesterol transport system auxiliary component